MSNFFQKAQNNGFWYFGFWFLSKGKKNIENYCLYECQHIIIKKWINQSPTQYCALLLNFYVRLKQIDSSVDQKMVNYWAEICKLYARDGQNVVLYIVTI